MNNIEKDLKNIKRGILHTGTMIDNLLANINDRTRIIACREGQFKVHCRGTADNEGVWLAADMVDEHLAREWRIHLQKVWAAREPDTDDEEVEREFNKQMADINVRHRLTAKQQRKVKELARLTVKAKAQRLQ